MVQEAYPSFTWLNPTKVIFGVGKLAELSEVTNRVAGPDAKVFLVTGRNSLKNRGILQKVLDSLGPDRVTLYDEVIPFPPPGLVDAATERCRAAGADVVIGIGGGSVLDVAKCVAILMRNEGKSHEYALGEKSLERPGLPFIAVPTTSGSSSEVTSGAALWDMEAKRHMGLSGPLMFPTVAIVDPELAMSMPMSLAAASGMDAFTSAFESYWSNESEPIADALDLEVINLFARNLDRSCIQGDLESRSNCALAATMSGIAYSNSRPNVCHGVGSPLTIYWGVEHGQAVGISLTWFLRWNAPAIPHKLPALWNALGVSDLDEAVEKLTRTMKRCGLKTRLSELGLTGDDRDLMVDNIRWDRTMVLPRPLTHDDGLRMFADLL